MPQVRTHKVRGPTGPYTRHRHNRRGNKPGMWSLQPHRSARNAGRAFMAWKHRRRAVAIGLAGLAVGEILGFMAFKGAGGILIGVGLTFSLIGAGLLVRAKN